MKTCSVRGCPRKLRARGWCKLHYQRWAKWGDPEHVPPRGAKTTVAERFVASVDRTGDCWEWQGAHDREGYARTAYKKQNVLLHRWAYEHFVGPIPEGYVVDHICHNKGCVNPKHLRACSVQVNCQNRLRANRDNRSAGRLGVKRSTSGRFEASVKIDSVLSSLGSFDDLEVAAWVAFRARQELYDLPNP